MNTNIAKFVRNGKTIRDLSDGTEKVFTSINAAKKESRKIQMRESGRLGSGILRDITNV